MISKKVLKAKTWVEEFFENKLFEIQKIVDIFGTEKAQRLWLTRDITKFCWALILRDWLLEGNFKEFIISVSENATEKLFINLAENSFFKKQGEFSICCCDYFWNSFENQGAFVLLGFSY